MTASHETTVSSAESMHADDTRTDAPKETASTEAPRKSCSGARPVLIALACGLIYFVILEVFLAIPQFNVTTQVRPAAGVGPVFGLFFGWPGIIGCALGNAVSDLLSGETADIPLLAVYTAIQAAYNALPYLGWYVLFRKRKFPYPRLDSAAKVVAYILLMALASCFVTALLMPFETDTMSMMDIHLVRVLNNIVFLIYLGMPLLIALERSPLEPAAPRSVRQHAPYTQRPRMNLTQRLLVGATGLFAAALVLFLTFGYASYFFDGSVRTSEDLAALIGSIYMMTALFTAVLYLPLIIVMQHLETHYTRPLEVLTDASRSFVTTVEEARLSDGTLHAGEMDKTGLVLKNEIGDLFAATETMRSEIENYVVQLGEATAERERTAAELDIASRIQLGAVPHDFELFKERYHLDIAAVLKPAREVGGDFYDVFDAGNHRVGFLVADVSGKGVPAALFMMRALAELREQMQACSDVGEAFTRANNRLCEHNDEMLFVTVFGCVLDVANGRISFANAGHNPPWVRRGDVREWLQAKPGLVMGVMDGVGYRSHELDLQPGDGLFMYTDGVTEAMDKHESLYGSERLEDALYEVAGCGVDEAVESVMASLGSFAEGAPQADDITMLAFSWNLAVSSLVLPPDDRALNDLFAFIDEVCTDSDCGKKTAFDMKLVLEELFVNVAHYGFPEGHPRQSVHIEAAVDAEAGCIHAVISDAGIPYDPFTYQPEKPAPGKELKIGGLGILLAKECTERMSYERVEGRNVVHLVFKMR